MSDKLYGLTSGISPRFDTGPQFTYLLNKDGGLNPDIQSMIKSRAGSSGTISTGSYYIPSAYTDGKAHGSTVWQIASGAGINHDGFKSLAVDSNCHLVQQLSCSVSLAQTGKLDDGSDASAHMQMILDNCQHLIIDGLYWHLTNEVIVDDDRLITGECKSSIVDVTNTTGERFHAFNVRGDQTCFRDFAMLGNVAADNELTHGIATDGVYRDNEITRVRFGARDGDPTKGFNVAVKYNEGFEHGLVQDSEFRHLRGTTITGQGVLTGRSLDIRVNNSQFYGIQGVSGRHAVYYSVGTKHSSACGNYIENMNSHGMTTNSNPAQEANQGITFSKNDIVNCALSGNPFGAGIGISGKNDNINLTDNNIYGGKGHGISVYSNTQVKGSTKCVNIRGGKIKDQHRIGINLHGTQNCNITDVCVDNSSREQANLHSNVRILSDVNSPSKSTLVTALQSSSSAGGVRSPIQVNPSVTLPTGVKIANSNIDPAGFFTGPEYNGATVAVI